MGSSEQTRTIKTTDHPAIRLRFSSDSVVTPDIDWLECFLTRDIASGTRYKPAELIQIGWMILKVRGNEDGSLSFLEPDFQAAPIEFVDSVTQTLVQLRLQKNAAESVGLENSMTFPSLLQSCLTCTNLSDRAEFMMERFEPAGTDSGWYLGCNEPGHDHNDVDNLCRKSLYEVACYRPDCIPFLALPRGSFVGVGPGELTLRLEGRPLLLKDKSFLEQYLLRARQRRRARTG